MEETILRGQLCSVGHPAPPGCASASPHLDSLSKQLFLSKGLPYLDVRQLPHIPCSQAEAVGAALLKVVAHAGQLLLVGGLGLQRQGKIRNYVIFLSEAIEVHSGNKLHPEACCCVHTSV